MAAAAMADGRAGLTATSATTDDASGRDGGEDGGGPSTGGDATPQPGQSQNHDQGHGSEDSSGSEESDSNNTSSWQIDGGGDGTPPAVSMRWGRSWMWTEEGEERWRAQVGAASQRRYAQGDREVEFVGGGGRSRRGARCLRPQGWRRWLAGQRGPADCQQLASYRVELR